MDVSLNKLPHLIYSTFVEYVGTKTSKVLVTV